MTVGSISAVLGTNVDCADSVNQGIRKDFLTNNDISFYNDQPL